MSAFFVPGVPVPQGSHTAFVVKGRAVVTSVNNKALKPWRKAIAAAAREAVIPFEAGTPVRVDVTFVYEKPASVRRMWPTVRPDLDKLLRAVFDALTESGCIHDDAQIVAALPVKTYGLTAGAHIRVSVAGAPDREGMAA